MLVLSRVKDQSIQVGGTLITVTKLTKDKVTLELSGQTTGTHKLQKNESFQFDPDCTIVVVEIRSSDFTGADKKVRLGIEAPREVPVHRKEVWDAIKRNEEAQDG